MQIDLPLSPDRVMAARIEAVAHAAAILLATRLSELSNAEAVRACEVFSTPLAAEPGDVPAEANGVRRQHRAVMVDTLESIADRALQLRRPGR